MLLEAIISSHTEDRTKCSMKKDSVVLVFILQVHQDSPWIKITYDTQKKMYEELEIRSSWQFSKTYG